MSLRHVLSLSLFWLISAYPAAAIILPAPGGPYTALAKTSYGDGIVITHSGPVTRIDMGPPGSEARVTYYADYARDQLVTDMSPTPPFKVNLHDADFPYSAIGVEANPGSTDRIAGEACTNYDYQGTSSGFIACITSDWIPLRVEFVDNSGTKLVMFEVIELNRGKVDSASVQVPDAPFAPGEDHHH